MSADELIEELPKGLLCWYDFKAAGSVLYIDEGDEVSHPLVELLQSVGLCVRRIDIGSVLGSAGELREAPFDYVVMSGAVERCETPLRLLERIRKLLVPDGCLLFGMDNRLGIRYFCGDRDAYTDRNFDGIENYFRVDLGAGEEYLGRAYSKAEMAAMLETAGFTHRRFYSVFPDLLMPQVLYAEDYLPEEELDIRVTPEYNSPDTVFLEEECMYSDLAANGLFHIMANAYLVECPLAGDFAAVRHVTVSMDRGRERALATLIRRDGTVVKRALYTEGEDRLQRLAEYTEELRTRGVKLVDGRMVGGEYVMPYIQGEVGTRYFRRLLVEDKERFLEEMDRFREIVIHSSEHVPYEQVDWDHFDPDWEKHKADDPNRERWKQVAFGPRPEEMGPILRHGFIDLVCLNCFYAQDDFLFFDQEFYFPQLPANTILWRTISLIYRGSSEREAILPMKKLLKRYHMTECEELWRRGSTRFTDELRNKRQLREFHQNRRRDAGVVHSNRQRVNYSEAEYKRLFHDIFRNTKDRQLYLFGAGNFAKRFLSRFEGKCQVAGILDNSAEKWGTDLEGIPVMSPQVLRGMSPETYKVIICIKNYLPIARQLQRLGTEEYGIFDWSLEYSTGEQAIPRTQVPEEGGRPPKKYHVGYVAGVFDLFHIGHLNLLRRAKEQCDYLIAGIVSDEGVRRKKGTNPAIPFEERAEIVRACRYVDEVVKIPLDYADTDEAYRKYHFDVQFSGSDYAEDPKWLAKKAFLNKHGADLVFFPYTQGTSSTKLKEMMTKKLL